MTSAEKMKAIKITAKLASYIDTHGGLDSDWLYLCEQLCKFDPKSANSIDRLYNKLLEVFGAYTDLLKVLGCRDLINLF